MKKRNSKWLMALIATPVILTAFGLCLAAAPGKTNPTDRSKSKPVLSPETIKAANSLSNAFRDVSAYVLPSVVAIENRPDTTWKTGNPPSSPRGQLGPGQLGPGNPFKGTPFEDLFPGGVPMNPQQRKGIPNPGFRGGIGSGVIIDSAGVVLTNNHVVAGGGKVIIKTHDGREFVAEEVLTDPKTDIAVVKFKGDSSLTAATLGDSDEMQVGDWVVALGQPFGLKSTVTAGIVSAKNRGVGITARENFIQTDAAINPGNSGGPLVNLKGEVIGINTAISSRSGGNDGIGFAVPSNLAQWVSDQLVAKGRVNRSYLGVGIQPVSYELSSQLGVAPKSGVAVTEVFPNTPASEAGLQVGDVIVRFGNKSIQSPQQLQLAVERSPKNEKTNIEVIRDGMTIQLKYEPQEAPEDFGTETEKSDRPVGTRKNQLGLELSELTADVARQLGLNQVDGILITGVQEGTAADQAGLKPGMVIVQVNRKPISKVSEFDKLVKADTDGSLLLLVRSEQGSRFVVINQ